MTVENTNNTISYTGNSSVDTFAYNFLVYQESHLFIYFDDILQTVGYTVTDIGEEDGGNVVFDTPPDIGVTIRIDRTVPETQLIEYQEYGPFPAKTNERGLDLLTMAIQQNSRDITREFAKKMDIRPLAQENNIVIFDGDGNSKDSGVNIQDGFGVASKRVIPYDNINEVLADDRLINIFEGSKIKVKERTEGFGGGGDWEVVLTSSVTPNNYDIVQCVALPQYSLSLIPGKSTSYAQFGADLTGTTPADNTLKACHDFANAHNIPVTQRDGTVLWRNVNISVKTDTDLRGMTVIMDELSGVPGSDYGAPRMYKFFLLSRL